MKKEKLWIILFLFFSSIMCVAIFLVSGNTYSVAVESQNGVWDLREMDFDAYNVSLTGEVEYIPYALLSPEEFAESDNIIVGKIPNVPYLTSRVRLIVPENQHFNMAGYADDFGSNIFVNGVLLTSVGRPADNAEDNIPSERFIRFTAFSKDGEIEIIQQTSNFVFRSNTSHKNWIIGNQESVWRWVLTYTYVFIFNAGFFIALFFVHLLLFIILPRNKANLWFSLLCLALFIRTGIIFIRPMVVMLRLPWAFSLRTEYITMLCGLVLMTLACNIIFPGVLNKKFAHALYAISGAFLLVFIFASTYFASQTILHYHLLSCAWAAYVVIRIFISKPDFKQRIIFTGFIVVFIALVLDFLFYYMEPVLHSSVTEIAILILLMFQLTAMLLGTIEDAATLREAEHKLALENASLDRLNRLKTHMMATISHELKTPLAVIMGYAQLTAAELKDKGVDEQAVSDLDAMVLETQRLGRLVDETQKASLSQHEGKSALIEATIKQLTKLYSPILEKRNTRLIIEIEKELPAVRCGQDELMQVLFNLLNNADKHGKSDEISITAKLEGDFIKVCVSEKSIGITPEDLPHIFDKYFVGGERGTAGSGLGLFICKEIIEAQGGNIKIESVFGKGTSACFTLPIIQKQSC